jgi:hypothetical protein
VIPSTLLSIAFSIGGPTADPELQKRAEQLVAHLGDREYRERERASKALLEMGYVAKDAVLAGQKNPDGEISERCRKLYPAIFRHDLEKRVAKFLDNPDGLVPDDLPGATKWLKLVGDGKESRELYAAMVKGHPEILLDAELNPGRVHQILTDFMRDVYSRTYPRPTGGISTVRQGAAESEVLLYFFLGAQGEVRRTAIPGVSSTYYYQFLNSQFTASKLTASPPAVPFRKLFVAWLEKERYSLVMRRALDMAGQNDVKECAPVALKLAGEAGVPVTYRASGLIAFGKLGTKDQLKDLEPFLKDKLHIANVAINAERGTVQMRDVALGAAVQIAGLSLADFGFERRPPTGAAGISTYTYFAFGTDEKREAAHAKWKEWAEKNLKK